MFFLVLDVETAAVLWYGTLWLTEAGETTTGASKMKRRLPSGGESEDGGLVWWSRLSSYREEGLNMCYTFRDVSMEHYQLQAGFRVLCLHSKIIPWPVSDPI